MFPWSRPKPPLDAPDKLWVEQGLTWLIRTFGVERLRSAPVVLPTPEFFPDPYDPVRGTDDDARALLDRVCGYAAVPPSRVRLRVYPGAPIPDVDVGQEVITTVRDNLADPAYLVARMAHACAKVRLLDEGKAPPDHPDLRRLADLTAIYLGLGVFVANQLFREELNGAGLSQSWSLLHAGNLSERAAGYALALFARVRGEGKEVGWARSLRPNVRQAFRDGLAYVAKTGDTQFRLDDDPEERGQTEEQRLARYVAALQAPSSGARLAALWDLEGMGPTAAPAVPALVRAMRDEEPSLQAAAAEALGGVGPAAEAAVPELIEAATQEKNRPLQLRAVCALGAIGRRAEHVVPMLARLLRSPKKDRGPATIPTLGAFGMYRPVEQMLELPADVGGDVAEAAALALGALGPAARAAVPALLRMLHDDGCRPAAAAHALGRVGTVDDAVVPALLRLRQHAIPDVREEAEDALRRLAPELIPDPPAVCEGPTSDERVRRPFTGGVLVRSSRFTAG